MKKNDIFLYGIYLLICICIILIPFDLSDKIDNNFITIIINDIISFVKILVFLVLINIGLLSFADKIYAFCLSQSTNSVEFR